MGTQTIHVWTKPNDEGISTCENCPCMRRVRGKYFKTYKSKPADDWKRKVPVCTKPKGLHRAKICTATPPPRSDKTPAASNT
jgi:hypothetical protein